MLKSLLKTVTSVGLVVTGLVCVVLKNSEVDHSLSISDNNKNKVDLSGLLTINQAYADVPSDSSGGGSSGGGCACSGCSGGCSSGGGSGTGGGGCTGGAGGTGCCDADGSDGGGCAGSGPP